MSTHALVPLPVVLPLAIAALLAGAGDHLPRRVVSTVSLLTAAAVAVVCGLLARAAYGGTIVYWFGNWRPDARAGSAGLFPTGVCFAVEPMGAGMATLAAVLTVAGLSFAWVYFKEVKALFHGLMLAFLAAMCGLCLSGDLFNLFVWFELMTAVAVALCGYEVKEPWPLLGALNFAVVNSIGAFVSLGGIALVYAYTGSLNMADIGRMLVALPPGVTFVAIAFVMCCAGFLVKSALVPFHFWLADAHAVAPTPVCVLFSGVMVELGLLAIARLYFATFAPALADHADAVRALLMGAGAITALTGAVYGFGQRHLKRLLAFSTISHVGLMTIGLGLQRGDALAGVGLYVVGHGLIKGTLFLCSGMILHRCGGVDEHDLRGQGRNLRPIGVLMVVAAWGLAGLPPFATFYGLSSMHVAAEAVHASWITPVVVFAEAMTSAAVLRATARIFWGLGARREASSRGAPHVPMDSETASGHDNTPATMWVPAVLLLALSAGLAVPSAFRAAVATAAAHLRQTTTVAAAVLEGKADPINAVAAVRPSVGIDHTVTLVLITLLLVLTLRPTALARLNWPISRAVTSIMRPLRRVQSGNAGDYVAWFILGFAAYGGILLLLCRH